MFEALVLSDTHGDAASFERAIELFSAVEVVLHLGDGARDVEKMKSLYPAKEFYFVRGNNDYGPAPEKRIFSEGTTKVLMTHGHRFGVKRDLSLLVAEASVEGCGAVLFGHTHRMQKEYRQGILLFNPGSARIPWIGAPSFGLLRIERGEVSARHFDLKGNEIFL